MFLYNPINMCRNIGVIKFQKKYTSFQSYPPSIPPNDPKKIWFCIVVMMYILMVKRCLT